MKGLLRVGSVLATLFALRGMSHTWKTQPPYPHWKDYAKALVSYSENCMEKAVLP